VGANRLGEMNPICCAIFALREWGVPRFLPEPGLQTGLIGYNKGFRIWIIPAEGKEIPGVPEGWSCQFGQDQPILAIGQDDP